MKWINYKKIYFSIILLFPLFILAQNTTEEYNQIKEKYNSSEFKYIEENEIPTKNNDIDPIKPLINFIDWINWEAIMYIVIGLLICFIIFKLYQNGFIFQFKKSDYTEEELHFDYIENNLLSVDLNKLIKQAKDDGDFRLAIRYYHYQNTQNLAQKNYFKWDPKKTNQQIINEIPKREIKDLFINNTLIFNQVWFGNFYVDQEKFLLFETNYLFLNQSL